MPPRKRSNLRTCCSYIALTLALSAVSPTNLLADQAQVTPPSPENGRKLAEKFCKTCHVIDQEGNQVAQVGPPTFPTIANKPGQTAERIMGALIAPHPPMPDMQLTNAEIRDLIAYLDTLRPEGAPPLQKPGEGSKPEFPDPT